MDLPRRSPCWARLASAAEEAWLRDCIRGGMARERSLFLPEEGNWPDLRTHRLDVVATSIFDGVVTPDGLLEPNQLGRRVDCPVAPELLSRSR